MTAPDGRDRRLRHALEIRHDSWLSEEAVELLSRLEIAIVAADTAGLHPYSLLRTSASLAYVRLHGARRLYEGAYTGAELDAWADRCRAWAAQGAEVYVYFDNDRDAQAPRDALRLQSLIRGDPATARPEPAVAPEPRAPRPPPEHFGFRRRPAPDQAGRPAARRARRSSGSRLR